MSLSGYQVAAVCAPDTPAAIFELSKLFPAAVSGHFVSLDADPAFNTGSGIFELSVKSQDINSAASSVTSIASVYLPACDPAVSTTAYFDGMTMGWGIVAAMAVAASIMQIKHSFFR